MGKLARTPQARSSSAYPWVHFCGQTEKKNSPVSVVAQNTSGSQRLKVRFPRLTLDEVSEGSAEGSSSCPFQLLVTTSYSLACDASFKPWERNLLPRLLLLPLPLPPLLPGAIVPPSVPLRRTLVTTCKAHLGSPEEPVHLKNFSHSTKVTLSTQGKVPMFQSSGPECVWGRFRPPTHVGHWQRNTKTSLVDAV